MPDACAWRSTRSSSGVMSTGREARLTLVTDSGSASGTLSGVCDREALLDSHTGLKRSHLRLVTVKVWICGSCPDFDEQGDVRKHSAEGAHARLVALFRAALLAIGCASLVVSYLTSIWTIHT